MKIVNIIRKYRNWYNEHNSELGEKGNCAAPYNCLVSYCTEQLRSWNNNLEYIKVVVEDE